MIFMSLSCVKLKVDYKVYVHQRDKVEKLNLLHLNVLLDFSELSSDF